MNTTTVSLLAAMLVAPALVLADPTVTYHRDSIGPSGVKIAGVGKFGAALCDGGNPPLIAILACGSGGISAIIDVSALEDNHVPHHHFAVGTCSVEPGTPSVPGSYSYVCGTDRDDDSFVTNVDGSGSLDPDGFDDDFAQGFYPDTQIGICFRRDIDVSGHDWDTWGVFILMNLPNGLPPGAGIFSIDVTATATDSCGPGQNVSAHTHGNYLDGMGFAAAPSDHLFLHIQ